MGCQIKSRSNFNSIKEMDDTVKEYNKELNKSQYRVLDTLRRYSCVYIGVSYLRQDKIAEHLDLSRRTVWSALQKLQEKGMITIVHMKRPKRKNNGACEYIIHTKEERDTALFTARASQLEEKNKVVENEQPQALEEDDEQKETLHSFKHLNNSLSIPHVENTPSQVRFENMKNTEVRVKPMNCSKELYSKLKPFFTDAQIYRHIENIDVKLFGKYLSYFNKHDVEMIIEYALMTLVKKMKKGFRLGKRLILNEFAFANGVALNYAEKVYDYGYQL